MTNVELETRLIILQNVVDRLMSIIQIAATPEQLEALDMVDDAWGRSLRNAGYDDGK